MVSQAYQKLQVAKKDSPLQTLEGEWPCQHLDFKLKSFKIVRGYILTTWSRGKKVKVGENKFQLF